MKIIRTLIAMTIGLAALTAAACSNEPQAQPAVPNTPLPPPTVEVVPTSTLTPTAEPLTIRPSAQTQSQTQQPAQAPVQTQQQAPMPTQPPTMSVIPTQPPAVPTAPPPTPTVSVVEVPSVAIILPTETTVPTQEPTVGPTAEPTATQASPTATMVPPTPEPTATKIPLPTPIPTPTDTSAPYIIVVDFYAGNTFKNPGAEACNPARCGGALIQFSEPVITHSTPILVITHKGLMKCFEGCSTSQASSFMHFTGDWIEPEDTLVDASFQNIIPMAITDVAGNELESYKLPVGPARASDFAMVEGPTPIPTPIPESISNVAPRVHKVVYDDNSLHLHITEPVVVNTQQSTDIGVNITLADGSDVRGTCIDPCNGENALLSFNVPELAPDSIATSFDIHPSAQIRDYDGMSIEEDFEAITLGQIPRIHYIEIRKVPLPAEVDWWGIHLEFDRLVASDAINLYMVTDSGVVIPCDTCVVRPNIFSNYFIFFMDPYDLIDNPVDITGQYVVELVFVDGMVLSETGQLANLTFEPLPLTHDQRITR